MKKEEYTSIDIARLFFAVCIVCLHSGVYYLVPGEWYFLHGLLRLAVPFFFVVSGFFYGKNCFESGRTLKESLIRYEKRLMIPYIVFSCINILLNIVEMMLQGEKFIGIAMRVVRSVIFYPYGALWYIWACMVAAVLLYIVLKGNKLLLGVGVGVILYAIALLMNSYYFLIEGTWIQRFVDFYLRIAVSARNGLFVGFIFMSLGVVIAKFENEIKRKNKLPIYCVCFFSYMSLLVEIYLLQGRKTADDHSLFLSFLLLIPSLVITLLYNNVPISERIAKLFRNLSAGIYYLHRCLLMFLNILSIIVGFKINRVLSFAGVLALSICICLWVYKKGKEPYVSLLK